MIGFKTIEEFNLAECEDYLARTDISSGERQRAEKRKAYLISLKDEDEPHVTSSKSIIKEFPEYNFIPTPVLRGPKEKKSKYGRSPISIGCFFLLAGAILLGLMAFYYSEGGRYGMIEEHYKDSYQKDNNWEDKKKADNMRDEKRISYNVAEVLLSTGIPVFACGLLLIAIGYGYRKYFNPIKTVADYILKNRKQGCRMNRMIFVRNRKFGVLTTSYNQVIVPPEYDKLLWRDKNILYAEKCGREFLIDIMGNELT
jgi:hypothetical protein